MKEEIKSRLDNIVFVKPATIRAGRQVYLLKNIDSGIIGMLKEDFIDGTIMSPLGKLEEIVDKGKTLNFRINLNKKINTREKNKQNILEKLNNLLLGTDFSSSILKDVVVKGLFYNFTNKELEEIFKEEDIEFVVPPRDVTPIYQNPICLRVKDKYYLM